MFSNLWFWPLFLTLNLISTFLFWEWVMFIIFIEVPIESQESKWSCVKCVNGIYFASFYDFYIWLWNCSDRVVFWVFHVVIEDPTVICRTVIKALLLYFCLYQSVKLDSPSCSFIYINILSYNGNYFLSPYVRTYLNI